MNERYPPAQMKVLAGLTFFTLILFLVKNTATYPLIFYLILALRHVITARIRITLLTYAAAFVFFCGIYFLAFWSSSCTIARGTLAGIPAGIGAGLLFIALRYKDMSLFFDKTFFTGQQATPSPVIVRSIVGVAGAAVFQEIFFRGYLICAFSEYYIFSVLISSFLFVLDHFLAYRSARAFTGRDYFSLFFLSLLLGIIYYYTGSLIGCILGHLTFNSPRILWLVIRYKYRS